MWCRVWLAGLEVPLTPFRCSLLFAWREGTVELSVYEEIRQDSARAPWYSVCPSLDARSSFLVHKDVPTYDQLTSFAIMRSTKAVGQSTSEASLEDDQRVLGGLNVPSPRWHTCRSFTNVHGKVDDETGGGGRETSAGDGKGPDICQTPTEYVGRSSQKELMYGRKAGRQAGPNK